MEKPSKPSNVIQFPDRKVREVEAVDVPAKAPSHNPPPAPKDQPAKRKRRQSTLAATLLAVAVASGAVNRFVFSRQQDEVGSSSLSSNSRTIASVGRGSVIRDSAWERSIADSMASAQMRDVASVGVGKSATKEEKLKWGTLEEKYTIKYKSEPHLIESIVLQDPTTDPSYVLDRKAFLNDYGVLLQDSFESAQLKSVEVGPDKRLEFYTLFDKSKKAKAEARFELDSHKRLLSLTIHPPQS